MPAEPLRTIAMVLLSAVAAVSQIPAGAMVVSANVDGNWDLFLLRAGDRGPLRLTETPVDERAPALSPDRKTVAYSTSDGAIYLLSLESRRAERLALPKGSYGHPAWSSDGRTLVFTAYQFGAEEDADLLQYDLAERKASPYLRQEGIQDYARFAMDGSSLAYTTADSVALAGFEINVVQTLWMGNLRDGKTRPVLLSAGLDTEPVFSPDGKRMAFASDRAGNLDLWLLELATGRLSRLTHMPEAETCPRWSPDGSTIAYVWTSGARQELRMLNLKTLQSTRIDPFPGREVPIRSLDWR